jgi:hypothetical protein
MWKYYSSRDVSESDYTQGLKFVCSECMGGAGTTMYYPEITGFNRKELPAGSPTASTGGYIPYKSAEEKALEELKLHCV